MSKLFYLLDFSEIMWPKCSFGWRGQYIFTFNRPSPMVQYPALPVGDSSYKEKTVTPSCSWGKIDSLGLTISFVLWSVFLGSVWPLLE